MITFTPFISPDQRVEDLEVQVEALLTACKAMTRKPRGNIADCPVDISSELCYCGFHDALDLAKEAIAKVENSVF